MGTIRYWLHSTHYYSMELVHMYRGVTSENATPSVRGGGQMATLLSLLYGGGGEVWKPEGNWYIRLTTTTLWIEVCIRNSSCHRSLSLWNVLRV